MSVRCNRDGFRILLFKQRVFSLATRDRPSVRCVWRSQKSAKANLLGNLVIVDTPGPNEAGENLRLVNVVSEQLQNSSLVLLVLDFTQLREEATIQDLENKAERLWKKSGFAPFLEKAIGALMADAAPRCMISALNIACGRLAELH